MKLSSGFILCIFFIISCKSERQKEVEQIEKKSNEIFNQALGEMAWIDNTINTDSILKIYTNILYDSAELGLEYAEQMALFVLAKKDSIALVHDSLARMQEQQIEKVKALEKKQWENSKAGKIQKKHPEWSKEDCERIAERKVWIGMSLDMIKYMRGNPNSANPSDYGNGVQWQWCWHDYTPSCFYGGNDGIITAYN